MATPKTIILLNKSSLLDTKANMALSSFVNPIGNDSIKIRKRQRLDHLSTDEKLMRRKLKNRVAAQSARDRKKARMDVLEIEVEDLHNKVEKLFNKVTELNKKNDKLEIENEELRKRLSLVDTPVTIKEEPLDTQLSSCKDSLSHESLEYAEGTGSVGGSSLDDALRWLADVESDQLMDVLHEITQQLQESIDTDTDDIKTEIDENATTDRMVGPIETGESESDIDDTVIIVSQNEDDEFVSEIILEEDGSTTTENSAESISGSDDLMFANSPNLYEDEDDKFKSIESDSDYESSGSVYSPLGSDIGNNNYFSDDENPCWEESFQELFPSLL